MKAHIEAVHKRKKPNKYSICDYSALQKQHLKTHIESVHERKKPPDDRAVVRGGAGGAF